jgi:hypothetical protein
MHFLLNFAKCSHFSNIVKKQRYTNEWAYLFEFFALNGPHEFREVCKQNNWNRDMSRIIRTHAVMSIGSDIEIVTCPKLFKRIEWFWPIRYWNCDLSQIIRTHAGISVGSDIEIVTCPKIFKRIEWFWSIRYWNCDMSRIIRTHAAMSVGSDSWP